MNFRARPDSAHASNIHSTTALRQAVRSCAWRRGWTMASGCMVDYARIAAIFTVAVRPKHPPL
jgi:hypothetical protein